MFSVGKLSVGKFSFELETINFLAKNLLIESSPTEYFQTSPYLQQNLPITLIIFVTLSNIPPLRPLFPFFPFENKVNTTQRGAADVIFERVT